MEVRGSNMTYTKQTWVNGPAGATPISASRLNHMEDGIGATSLRVNNEGPLSLKDPRVNATLDGVTDDRPAFEAAFALLAGGGELFIPPGIALVSKSGVGAWALSPPEHLSITGVGDKSVIKAALYDSNVSIFRLVSKAGFKLRHLKLDGNRAVQSGTHQRHGVFLDNCTDFLSFDVTYTGFDGDGLYFGYETGATRRPFVLASRFKEMNRNGITLGGCTEAFIGWCEFDATVAAQAIDSEPPSQALTTNTDIWIVAPAIRSTDQWGITTKGKSDTVRSRGFRIIDPIIIGGGILSNECDDVYIIRPRITSSTSITQNAIQFQNEGSNLNVIDPDIYSPTANGIHAVAAAGGRPRRLTISGGRIKAINHGIQLLSIDDAAVLDVDLEGMGTAASYGIRAQATLFDVKNTTLRPKSIKNFAGGMRFERSSSFRFKSMFIEGYFDDDQGVPTMTSGISSPGSDFIDDLHIGNCRFGAPVTTPFGLWASQVYVMSGQGGNKARSIYSVPSSPEGVITAPIGAMAVSRAGGAGTTLYIKESGTSNTGWVAK